MNITYQNQLIKQLREAMPDARIEVLGFGDGELTPAFAEKNEAAELTTHSDLQAALDTLAQRPGHRQDGCRRSRRRSSVRRWSAAARAAPPGD